MVVNMKNRIKKVISYFSFTLAIIIIISGSVGYLIMVSEVDASPSIKLVQKELSKGDNIRQERIDNASYDEEVDYARGAEIAEAKKNYHSSIEEYGIGSIYMPEANISVPILAGTSEWNLFNGVGTGRPNQELGEGLFVGLSHNLANDTLLGDIDKMNTGDYLYASDFEDVYAYKVIDQEVVHETDKDYFIEPSEGDSSKMLLYRCEGEYGTEYRRIVYSEFVSKEPISKTSNSILKGLNIELDKPIDIDGETEIEYEDLTDEKEEADLYDDIIGKVVSFIGKYDKLNNYFLSVYSQVDSYPLAFTGIIILLFGFYRFL